MSEIIQPVPTAVTIAVERYATTQHDEAAKWSNRDLLDESGIYDLHTLAARVYAMGYGDGRVAEATRVSAQLQRERDAKQRAEKAATEAATANAAPEGATR